MISALIIPLPIYRVAPQIVVHIIRDVAENLLQIEMTFLIGFHRRMVRLEEIDILVG